MTKTASELKDNGFLTEIAYEGTIEGYDVLILDVAGSDDGETYWQVRHSYVSKAGDNNFIPLAFGDGYSGFIVGRESTVGIDNYSVLTNGLGIDEETARELVDAIDDTEHLNSTSFDLANELDPVK